MTSTDMPPERSAANTTASGLTPDDYERIRAYAEKPSYLRSERDLLPDDTTPED